MASTTLVPLAPGSDIARELATSVYNVLLASRGGGKKKKGAKAAKAAAAAAAAATAEAAAAGAGAGAGAAAELPALTNADITQFLNNCKTAVTSVNYSAFVDEVLKHSDRLFAHPDAKQVEGVFSVLMAVVKATASSSAPVQKIVDIVSADTTHRTALRLRILAIVFNLLDQNTDTRFGVFLTVLRYAAASGQVGLLKSYTTNAQSWIEQWQLSVAQSRELYLGLYTALEAANDTVSSQPFLLKYLATYDGEDAATLAGIKPQAKAAIVGFVKTVVASKHTTHLIDMDAVRQLKSDADGAVLFQLLDIFATKTVGAFQDFAAANAEYMAALGLDTEDCLSSMRLLSLCSLAAASGTGAVSFADIAATLKIDDADVEQWVVSAVSSGLIAARIDQQAGEVAVSRYTPRVFGDADWLALQGKLHTWTDNVASLLATIRSARTSRSGGGAYA